MSITTLDEDVLSKARGDFAVILGSFEAAGQALAGVQEQSLVAGEGQIAQAIYNALGNTHTHIRELCDMLNARIMEPLDRAGIEASGEAFDRAGEVAKMGNDGETSVGDVTGSWNDDVLEDTSAMFEDDQVPLLDLDGIDLAGTEGLTDQQIEDGQFVEQSIGVENSNQNPDAQ